MNRVTLSRRSYAGGLIALCTLALLASTFAYISFFSAALKQGVWEHVSGFTRIIVPDTLLYLRISQANTLTEFLLLAAVKNSIAPATVWFIFRGNWYAVAAFNAACFAWALVYTRRVMLFLDASQRQRFPAVAVILTIICSYYAVGSLKEIPTLLGLTAFTYHFLTSQKAKAIAWLLFLIGFRFQFSYLILAVYIASRVRRNPFRIVLLTLAIIGAAFPLVGVLQLFTPVALINLREAMVQGANSVGSVVEYVRTNVPGASLFAILVRVVQSITEPIVLFVRNRGVVEDGSISVFHVHSLIMFILTAPAWVIVFFRRFRWMYKLSGRTDFGIVCSFLAIAAFAFGGTGLISQRFLVPLTALLLVVARIDPLREEQGVQDQAHTGDQVQNAEAFSAPSQL